MKLLSSLDAQTTLSDSELILYLQENFGYSLHDLAEQVGHKSYQYLSHCKGKRRKLTAVERDLLSDLINDNYPFKVWDERELKLCDLSPGAGALSLGFLQTEKVEVAYAFEDDKIDKLQYASNFGLSAKPEFNLEDVPSHDILVTSLAKADLGTTKSDKRNRFLEVLHQRKPKVFLVACSHSPAEPNPALLSFKQALISEDYEQVQELVLDYSSFPDSVRKDKHYFLLGMHKSSGIDLDATCQEIRSKLQTDFTPFNKVLEPDELTNDLFGLDKLTVKNNRLDCLQVPAGTFISNYKPDCLKITPRVYKNPNDLVISYGDKSFRKLSPNEIAMLNGFPAEYEILSNNYQPACKAVCASVNVKAVLLIAETLTRQLENLNYDITEEKQ